VLLYTHRLLFMTDSTEKTTLPKPTKSKNADSSVQISIKPKYQFEFVTRDTEKSECLNLVDFGGGAISVETVKHVERATWLFYTGLLTRVRHGAKFMHVIYTSESEHVSLMTRLTARWVTWRLHMHYRVLQCVTVCYSVLPCVAGCCSVLQCVVTWRLHMHYRGASMRERNSTKFLYRIHMSQRVTWLLHMGWLRLVGSFICLFCRISSVL